MSMIADRESSKLTDKLLKLISNHLSSRSECRGLEYIVTIGDDRILFEPFTVFVFPNRYRRCERDKSPVTHHVIFNHMPELNLRKTELGDYILDTSKLVKGRYKYQKSFNSNRRRWVRIN